LHPGLTIEVPTFLDSPIKKMSDATKGAGDDGQPRFRRSWFEHAGEVTKKKKVTDETNTPQTEEPPQPTGPKIGGARDFRRTRLSLDVADNDTGAADSDLLTTGGVQAYVQKVGAGPDTTHSRSLAAQPGWRRYWGPVTGQQLRDWHGLPEVKVSSFCYECHKQVEMCDGPHTGTCDGCARHKKQCLFMISYRYHPYEDWDIGKVPEYKMRELARNWQAAQKTSLAVATRTTISTPLPPPASMKMMHHAPPSAEIVTVAHEYGMAAKDAYHEDTYKSQQSRAERPYWAARMFPRFPFDHEVYQGHLPIENWPITTAHPAPREYFQPFSNYPLNPSELPGPSRADADTPELSRQESPP
jgi:hypothetical protein